MPARARALAVAALLLALPAMLGPSGSAGPPSAAPAATGPSAPPPFGIGDWLITGPEVLDNSSLVLDGNITIASGGSLTLANSTLQLYCRQGSTHGILVQAKGHINVQGSVVGAFDNIMRDYARPYFTIESGAKAQFDDSLFAACGVFEKWVDDALMGGICVYTDMNITNCTFSGSRTAITVFNSNVKFEYCTFRTNDWAGAISSFASTQFLYCNFSNNYAGVVPYRSNSLFQCCSFNDNLLGAVPDGSTCTFRGCSFNRNSFYGLYCNPQMGINLAPLASSVTAVDCSFIGNRNGMGGYWAWADAGGNKFPLWHNLYLTNGEFRDNYAGAVVWPRADPDLPREQSPCLWNVTGKTSAVYQIFDFNGDINIAGGELLLDGTSLGMDPGDTGWNKLEVKEGGGLRLVNGSVLRSVRPAFRYLLACRPSSLLELNGSTLRDCGWGTFSMEKAGPYIEDATLRISNSAIEYCGFALTMNGLRGGRIESTRLNGSNGCLWMSGSHLTASNSSVGLMKLEAGSVLECINCDRTPDTPVFSEGSRIELGWYLGLSAAWKDGQPADGANITIDDLDGQRVFNGSAGADGAVPPQVLWEATLDENGSTPHTPHTINCSRGPLHNGTSLEMLSNRQLVVNLSDDSPPSIAVLGPAPFAYLNTNKVEVVGTAQDDMGLQRVEVVVDSAIARVVYEAEAGTEGADKLSWNLLLELREGTHTLEALAADWSGNLNVTQFSFTVDLTSPNIYISKPADDYLTNISLLAVSGTAEPGAAVTVNGQSAQSSGGAFMTYVPLSEGINTVTAVATDAAGNANQSSVRVRLDTQPPFLDVRYDPPWDYVNRPQLNISGEMENGSSISVNGRRVVLSGMASSFRTLLFLRPGPNIISIVAVDSAGNSNISRRTVVLDTVPPSLEVIYPPDGFLTNQGSLPVQLMAEGGSSLAVDGSAYSLPGEAGTRVRFNLSIELKEGPNFIVLRAADAAGNSASLTRLAVLDTQPPALSLSSPANGTRSSNASIYLTGLSEPGAAVRVQGEPVVVGFSGQFSAEVRLSAGANRILVEAHDAAGNGVNITVVVNKTAGRHGETVVVESSLDWPFAGFLGLSAVAMAVEGAWLRRYLERRSRRNGGAG